MSDQPEFYFAYGSNMDLARMADRDIVYDQASPGTLDGHALRFNKRSELLKGSAAANVIPARESQVEGVVYMLSDDRQIEKLDRFEGYPRGYRREHLQVILKSGVSLLAWVYLANPAFIDDTLKPRASYLAHLLSARPFLSDNYYKQLLQVPCDDLVR